MYTLIHVPLMPLAAVYRAETMPREVNLSSPLPAPDRIVM